MRLTINLDDELHAIAKSLAAADGCSLNAAIQKLIRRGLVRRPDAAKTDELGLPIVPCIRTFTSEDVEKLDADLT